MKTLNLPTEMQEKIKTLEETFEKVKILNTEERSFKSSNEIKVFYKTNYTTGIITMITVKESGIKIIQNDSMPFTDLRKLIELSDLK